HLYIRLHLHSFGWTHGRRSHRRREREVSSLESVYPHQTRRSCRTYLIPYRFYRLTSLTAFQSYTYYGNALNYNLFTHPQIVSGLPFLKRYYLPKRVRESFKGRLESEGMWEE